MYIVVLYMYREGERNMEYWKWHGVTCKVVSREKMIQIADVEEWWEIEPTDMFQTKDGCMKVYIIEDCENWYAVIKHVNQDVNKYTYAYS